MDLTNMIAQAQGGQGIGMLSRRFNLDEAQTRAAVDQLAPAVMAGLRRETRSPDGLAGLLGALASGDHGRYLDGNDSGIVDDGNAILGHVFGSKDVSRGVAAHAAETTGIGSGILKQMLPVIAAMLMGALNKKTTGGTGGGLGNILGQVLGAGADAPASAGASGGGLGDILGQVLGGSSAGAGAAPGGGLGEILGQVLGQGTGSSRPASGGGSVGDILNSIFGAEAAPKLRDEATTRAGNVLGDILGRDTPSGSAADQLLEAINLAVRRK